MKISEQLKNFLRYINNQNKPIYSMVKYKS